MSARLALAELLSSTRGRSEQASAAYESLAKEYPNRWEVEAGWGQFCWHQRKLDDAARHYARAVELGGQDPRLFLDYGRVLYYNNRPTDAIDILSKAARLNPDNDEVHFELGSAYMRHGNYGAAVAELRIVKNVQPAQAYRYFYNLAYAEYRLGKAAEAKRARSQKPPGNWHRSMASIARWKRPRKERNPAGFSEPTAIRPKRLAWSTRGPRKRARHRMPSPRLLCPRPTACSSISNAARLPACTCASMGRSGFS